MRVVGVGGGSAPVAEAGQVRGAGVPIRDAVGWRVLEVEVAGGAGGALHDAAGLVLAFEGIEQLELFGEAAHGPGEAARPGAERRVALLRVGAAVVAVVDVEN